MPTLDNQGLTTSPKDPEAGICSPKTVLSASSHAATDTGPFSADEVAFYSAQVRACCASLGLHCIGFAEAGPVPEYAWFEAWLDAGHAADLAYLRRDAAPRADVRKLCAAARSVVVVALEYPFVVDETVPSGHGRLAAFARGTDYHLVLKRKLQLLAQRLSAVLPPPFFWRACVDTAPILERAWAVRAGLGFIGKNTLLIFPGLGSFTVLGELLLSVPLTPASVHKPRCGSCVLCLTACPTQAFPKPFVLDARRCISYWTIEQAGDIPLPIREAMGDRIFGCDLCQTVCPYNLRAADKTPGCLPLQSKPAFVSPPLAKLLRLGAAQYRKLVRQTALRRINRNSLLRNVAVALGNVGTPDDLPALHEALFAEGPLVRRHVAWALGMLARRFAAHQDAIAQSLLQAAAIETDAKTRTEICAALVACGHA